MALEINFLLSRLSKIEGSGFILIATVIFKGENFLGSVGKENFSEKTFAEC